MQKVTASLLSSSRFALNVQGVDIADSVLTFPIKTKIIAEVILKYMLTANCIRTSSRKNNCIADVSLVFLIVSSLKKNEILKHRKTALKDNMAQKTYRQ